MIKRTTVISVMLIVAVLFAGCASSGKQFNATHANDIQNGVQDKATILEWFGQPVNKVALAGNPLGCVERWTYTYAHAVGYGTVTEAHSLVVDFDANGKVCDHAYVKQK